jgi:ABC-type multidrug transport system fused ATPase/permease subunit
MAADAFGISFRDVSYRYPGADADVLQQVSFTIPARRLTVLVGHSGAGKSTAADLVLGLLPPTAGAIEADGHRVGPSATWQSLIGYVPQQIFLLDDTIAANVRFGAPVRTPDPRLDVALARAQASGFVAALAEGADTRVGERGGLLSGGQRQRIGIARALYRNPALLILDEATSALDATTEREILRTLEELVEDTTVMMVAHRRSTILAAHHVVVFEQGRVVDEGPVELLRARCAAFRLLLEGSASDERSVD